MNAKTTRRNAYSPGEPLVTQEAWPVERPGGMNTEPSASEVTRSMRQSGLHEYQSDEFHCDECSRVFDTERGLSAHMGRSHPDTLPWRDEEVLRELYIEKGYTTAEVADELGTQSPTICKWLAENDISTRDDNGARKKWVIQSDEGLRRLYKDRGMSTHEIGEIYDTSSSVVSAALRRFDIEARGDGEQPNNPKVRDEDVLRSLYHGQGLSMRDIADSLGVSPTTVGKWFDAHAIERRSRAGGQLRGEQSPHWKGGHSRNYGPLWPEQREKALDRDNHECVRCGMTMEEHLEEYASEVHVHHIIRYGDFDDDRAAHALGNLITLCQPCHSALEGLPVDNRTTPQPTEIEADGGQP